MKYKLLIVVLTLAVFAGTSAFAEDVNNESIEIKVENNVELEQKPDTVRFFKVKNMDLKQKRDEVKVRIDQAKLDLKQKRESHEDNVKQLIRVKREEVKGDLTAAIEARKAALKEEITNIKKEKLSVRKDFVALRLEAAAAFIAVRQERVAFILEKMKGNGKDVTEAFATLEKSKTALVSAKEAIAALKTASADSDTSTESLKALAKKAEESLKESKRLLQSALPSVEVKVQSTATVAQ